MPLGEAGEVGEITQPKNVYTEMKENSGPYRARSD